MQYFSQRGRYDCGHACMKMLTSNINKSNYQLTLANLNDSPITFNMNINRIMEIATSLGLEMIAGYSKYRQINFVNINIPIIIHIFHYYYQHYIVINRKPDNTFSIWDPNPNVGKYRSTRIPYNWSGYYIINKE